MSQQVHKYPGEKPKISKNNEQMNYELLTHGKYEIYCWYHALNAACKSKIDSVFVVDLFLSSIDK